MIRTDRFSPRARVALQRAADIVQRYDHVLIDTEHLLLSLIEQAQSPVPKLLEYLHVDSGNLIDRVVLNLKASPLSGVAGGMSDKYKVTVRVRQVFEEADKQAILLNDEHISTEHLFLAILTEQGTPAAMLLASSRLTYRLVIDALVKYRAGPADVDTLSWEE